MRPFLNIKQNSGIDKTSYYTVFADDGTCFDYPPWFLERKKIIGFFILNGFLSFYRAYDDNIYNQDVLSDCPYTGKYKYDGRCRDWYVKTYANPGEYSKFIMNCVCKFRFLRY